MKIVSDISCKNCGSLVDMGGLTGICGNTYSSYFGSEVRRDRRCPAHPDIVEMMANTTAGRRMCV